FSNVGTVAAAGSSQSMIRYDFVDDAPLQGISYYRLQQMDLTDQFGYSNTVAVLMSGNAAMEVHPNPAQDVLWLSIMWDREDLLSWQLLDMSGRLIEQGSFSAANGSNTEQIPVGRLEQGSYLLNVKDGGGTSIGISRFVKQ
ncbi:MAG: T9SS type A sorting domain-containing protein, partial [Bacteroidota bacterium]|nr:T9SS type A sorting domain-containing protein [Bacteroidota bacterium]